MALLCICVEHVHEKFEISSQNTKPIKRKSAILYSVHTTKPKKNILPVFIFLFHNKMLQNAKYKQNIQVKIQNSCFKHTFFIEKDNKAQHNTHYLFNTIFMQ